MATYQTHQKRALIAFLEKHPDRSFTIEELAEEMQADPALESPPGKSTIYRIMPALLDNHLVTRFNDGTGRRAAYQIVGGAGCHAHIHMKCTGCGRLFHMGDDQSAQLMRQIQQQNHFAVDLTQTLLYGVCEGCQQKGFYHE